METAPKFPQEPSTFSNFYANKIILAPMVKVGMLAFRLHALRYGADLVYSEEIIDRRFLNSSRSFNEVTQTVDYLDKTDGTIFFSTCEEERDRVILQIGTCDPIQALKVAKLVENDVFGIDINMGCPKSFSLKGGMGAALLKQPEKIKAILTTLVSNLKIPVTCKIRLVDTEIENTIKLCKMIESCGVAAVGVHGRTKEERPQHSNRNHYLKIIAESLKIPVIANGCSKEIKTNEDLKKYKELTGCSSIMIARAGEWNPSIFSNKGLEPIHEVIQKYLKIAVEKNNPFTTTKYTVQNMLKELQESPLGKRFLATQTMQELCDIWELSDFYSAKQMEYDEKRQRLQSTNTATKTREKSPNCEPSSPKRSKIISDIDLSDSDLQIRSSFLVPDCVFLRGHYPNVEELPKSILLKWVRTKQIKGPHYVTEFLDKRFRSKVIVSGEAFMTDVWEKNRKFAEQGAALACIRQLKLVPTPTK